MTARLDGPGPNDVPKYHQSRSEKRNATDPLTAEPSCKMRPGSASRARSRVWARRGTRPRAPHDQRYDWAYLFGAACPQRRVAAGLVMPAANAETMSLHLTAIGRQIGGGSPRRSRPRWRRLSHCGSAHGPRKRHSGAPSTYADSTRSKTSGNICAATNSPSPSSTTTTTSLIKPATHGTSLDKIQCASPQSPPEHGRLSMIRAVGIICTNPWSAQEELLSHLRSKRSMRRSRPVDPNGDRLGHIKDIISIRSDGVTFEVQRLI